MHKSALLLSLGLLASGCGGPSAAKRGYAKPTAASIVETLNTRNATANTFLHGSRMEYWVKDERVKATVYVMGQRGAMVRFNALDPVDNTIADLACDGANFAYVDHHRNCHLMGPCTKDTIGQLLRMSLEPDDFFLLAIGSTPVIPWDDGKVTWKSKSAQEIVKLTSKDGSLRQEIVLDGKEQRWDVLSSTVWGADGEIEWKLTNKEFSEHTTVDGKTLRLPAKTRFEQPREKADVSIRWDDVRINEVHDPADFQIPIPAVPTC